MGLFGKSNKKITDGYVQPTDDLPVATLVSEETMPQFTAPLNPSPAVVGNCNAGGPCSSSNKKYPNPYNVANDPTVSRFPMMMKECPNCHQESRTRVTTAPTWKTWTASGCLFVMFWPVCWVPLVMDSCKETEHFCVKCGFKVAKVEALHDCCVEHRG